MLLMLLVPGGLWLSSITREKSNTETGWSLRQCPPATPVKREELKQHPERFRNRSIWIVGRIQKSTPHCTSLTCATQEKCCQSCQARLFAGPGPHLIPLDGVLPHPKTRRPTRIHCSGNNCKMSCQPLQDGAIYAIAGRPLVRITQPGLRQRLQFQLLSFRVQRFCRLSKMPSRSDIPQIPSILQKK